MLTEGQARALLGEAGDTIEVGPDPGLPGRARRDRRRRRLTRLAAAAVVVGAVGAGTTYALTSSPSSSDGSAGPAGTPATSETPHRDLVTTPDITGLGEDLARRRLEQLGFTVTVVREASCSRAGTVLAQRPEAGSTVKWDEQVQLVVATAKGAGFCDGGTVTPAAAKIADAFIAFAGQATPNPPPSAPKVALGLGGVVRKQVAVADLADRSAWVLAGPYAQSTGPFSALEQIAQQPGASVRDYTLTGDLTSSKRFCSPDPDTPPADYLREGHVLSIQPPAGKDRTCQEWWSIDLTYDDTGRITGVFLVLGEP